MRAAFPPIWERLACPGVLYAAPPRSGQGDRTIKRWFDGIVDEEGEVVPFDELVMMGLKAGRHLGDKGGCLHLMPSQLGLINIDLELAYLLSGAAPTRMRWRARVYG